MESGRLERGGLPLKKPEHSASTLTILTTTMISLGEKLSTFTRV